MLKQTKVNPKKLRSLGYLAHFFVASSSYTLNWSQLKLRKFYPPESDSFKYTDERRGSRKLIPKKNRTLFQPSFQIPWWWWRWCFSFDVDLIHSFFFIQPCSNFRDQEKKNLTRLGEYSIWHAQTGFDPAWKKEWSKKKVFKTCLTISLWRTRSSQRYLYIRWKLFRSLKSLHFEVRVAKVDLNQGNVTNITS